MKTFYISVTETLNKIVEVHAEEFTLEELDRIGEELEVENPDGMDETEINDLMWFEPEYLASLIGLEWDSETGKIVR